MNEYNISKLTQITVDELIPWETNQSIVLMSDAPLEYIRQRRVELRQHNRHNVDDLELGNQEW